MHTHALLYRLNISQQLLTDMPFFLFILLESCNLFSILTFFTLADWYVYQHVNHCWNCLTQKLVLTFYFNYYCLLKKFLPPKTTRSLVCYTTFCRWSPKYQCEQKKNKPIERKKIQSQAYSVIANETGERRNYDWLAKQSRCRFIAFGLNAPSSIHQPSSSSSLLSSFQQCFFSHCCASSSLCVRVSSRIAIRICLQSTKIVCAHTHQRSIVGIASERTLAAPQFNLLLQLYRLLEIFPTNQPIDRWLKHTDRYCKCLLCATHRKTNNWICFEKERSTFLYGNFRISIHDNSRVLHTTHRYAVQSTMMANNDDQFCDHHFNAMVSHRSA